VDLWEVAPQDVRPALTDERRALLGLLDSIDPGHWQAATDVPGWTVKDLALHLLDDDLGWLSRGRDRDASGRLDHTDPRGLVAALAAKNQRWIDGARGLSLPVVRGLLEWSGQQMDAYYASMDLLDEGRVSWASNGPVPVWFDIAQDLTERWVHQMQMREAVGLVADYRDAYLPTVLRTFVWALPHQLRAEAPTGATIRVDLSAGGVWHLRRLSQQWHLAEGPPSTPPAGELWCSDEAGWRWFTGADLPDEGLRWRGPDPLGASLMGVRGILA
jgi:uncharacterized protein (TIGR03083 family)